MDFLRTSLSEDPYKFGTCAARAELGRQRALLWQTVEDISGELAVEPLLSRIVERACELIGADDGAIGLYDPELDCIRTAASSNIPQEQLRAVVPRGQGLMGRVLELNAPVYCRYGDLPHPTRMAALDMVMIGMPIRVQGRLTGVFGIGISPPRQFDETAGELLAHFARHAALAINNAKRHALEQRRAARFSLIARVTGIIASCSDIDTALQRAADVIHELLGYPSVDLPLIDPEQPGMLTIRISGGNYKRLNPNGRRLPIEKGIMGAAVRERRPQLVNDVARDPRYVKPPGVEMPQAELAVPIMTGDEVLGVLNVEGEHAFDELDLQSLEVIAEHLALAIQGARLYEQSRQVMLLAERQRLARELHDNVTQILSSINMISQSLADAWQRNPAEGAVRAERLSQLARMGFAELQTLLHELNPDVPLVRGPAVLLPNDPVGALQLHHQGLAVTIERLVLAMLPPHLEHRMDFATYRPQVLEHETALLRVCQEAASNAIRHADASCLEIEAGVDDSHAWLRISDDGKGISARRSPGMGVSNMWQRLLVLGGAFHIAARLPWGTGIEARLPRQDRRP